MRQIRSFILYFIVIYHVEPMTITFGFSSITEILVLLDFSQVTISLNPYSMDL